ncbi:hypothetical protein CDL12_17578 [Handroanthus impetiginosus]|uniref:Uncharacterized protein n=1 Tax=Handroanthus impetiginosus TaxID=429701 RepID=A0A2G9GX14_9LAMI|nr:hypothetical protein CDL12_17578 [Handroanthus impetiginosus]
MQGVAIPGDLGRLKDYTADHLVELGAGDLARSFNVMVHLGEELKRSREVEKKCFEENGKLKGELTQVTVERNFLNEKYSREVKFGRKFLESVAGQNWMENTKADAVQAFKESEEFKNAVMNEAADIYEQTVYDCRRILHGTGRVGVEDLVLLDPKLPVNFNDRGELVCPDNMEDEDDDAPPA